MGPATLASLFKRSKNWDREPAPLTIEVEFMDKKTMNTLLGALERMKEDSIKSVMKREEQGWKPVSLPNTLFEALSSLTKYELDCIRKNYNIKGISSLKKNELATELARQIPLLYKNIISNLDKECYELVQKIVKQLGHLKKFSLSYAKIDVLKDYSILFPGYYQGEKVLFMPLELVNAFLEIDSLTLQKEVQRNTTWINLTQGLLYYYGIMDSSNLIEKIEVLTKETISVMHFFNVIAFAADYYGQVSLNYSGLKDRRVFDHGKLIEEHKVRANLDYYPFTKAQLLAAGQPSYVEKNNELKDLLGFLKYHYEMKNEDLDEIALQLVTMINKDAQPAMAIQYLQNWIEIPSMDFLQELTSKVMNLYNNTRLWVLKGHTSREVAQIEQKHLQPLTKTTFPVAPKSEKVVPISNYTKIGRNNPCPCGSGKKHKNCCLK